MEWVVVLLLLLLMLLLVLRWGRGVVVVVDLAAAVLLGSSSVRLSAARGIPALLSSASSAVAGGAAPSGTASGSGGIRLMHPAVVPIGLLRLRLPLARLLATTPISTSLPPLIFPIHPPSSGSSSTRSVASVRHKGSNVNSSTTRMK
jgi:hypothetical protein